MFILPLLNYCLTDLIVFALLNIVKLLKALLCFYLIPFTSFLYLCPCAFLGSHQTAFLEHGCII